MFWKLENLNIWKLWNMKNDPWDMLNNFCFHVYAQKSLFIGQNVNGFFWQHPVSLEVIELVPVPVFLLDRVTRQLSTSGPRAGYGAPSWLVTGRRRRCTPAMSFAPNLHLIAFWLVATDFVASDWSSCNPNFTRTVLYYAFWSEFYWGIGLMGEGPLPLYP